jgi:hypothetical protein
MLTFMVDMYGHKSDGGYAVAAVALNARCQHVARRTEDVRCEPLCNEGNPMQCTEAVTEYVVSAIAVGGSLVGHVAEFVTGSLAMEFAVSGTFLGQRFDFTFQPASFHNR